MKSNYLFLSLFLMVFGTLLQAQPRNCGTTEYMEHLHQHDPQLRLNIEGIERHTNTHIDNPQRIEGVITIPVVFHVLWNTSVQNISDAQIQSQIDILNEDFRRMNADAVDTPIDFQGVAADVQIEFCLAMVDPSGNPTTGITRTQTNETSFANDGNNYMKYDATGGKDAWPTGDYLNIWTCNLDGTLLGFAQFPGGPAATDGVVIDYHYIGNMGTASPPYDQGRTATHEVGHWLNLYHIWGDGDCSLDDMVNDTPTASEANYTGSPCTYPGPNSCNDGPGDLPDMFQNYMDYSEDACMNLFTQGQSARMRALFDVGGFRASLVNSMGCSTPEPTCEDGMQNGDETGTDCGGTFCPPCGLPGGWVGGGINCEESVETTYDLTTQTYGISAENCYDPSYYSNNDYQGYIQRQLCGDGEIVAHVKGITGNAWAGVMMRESNAPAAKLLQLAVNAFGQAQRKLRTSTGGYAFNHTFQNQDQFWLKITRNANQFGAFMSMDGMSWNVVLQTNIMMSNCIEVGLFMSNGIPNSTASVTFDQVVVSGAASLVPASGATALSGAKIAPANLGISVYPNPTSGALNVGLDVFMGENLRLQVFNQQGQIVYIQDFDFDHETVEPLQLDQLSNGLYLIQVKSADKVAIEKINIIR